MTNEQIKKIMYKIYGDDNIRRLIVADRNGKTWVSIHLYGDKNEEVKNSCSGPCPHCGNFHSRGERDKLWKRFGVAYQNYRHQFGKPMRVSFSLDKRRLK